VKCVDEGTPHAAVGSGGAKPPAPTADPTAKRSKGDEAIVRGAEYGHGLAARRFTRPFWRQRVLKMREGSTEMQIIARMASWFTG